MMNLIALGLEQPTSQATRPRGSIAMASIQPVIRYPVLRWSGASEQHIGMLRAKSAPGDQRRRVLIVEDEEAIAEALAMIVEDAGYQAQVVYDGRQALALARERQPDLIITDLMMPYVTGAELIRAVRNDADTSGRAAPPIMLVTAASRMRAEEAGADMVLLKPFDVVKVEAALHMLLADTSD